MVVQSYGSCLVDWLCLICDLGITYIFFEFQSLRYKTEERLKDLSEVLDTTPRGIFI